MLIQQIVYGALLVAVGVLGLKFNYQIVGFTGRQDWIESKLGGGSTYFAYKLLSVIIIMAGVLYMTGLWGGVAIWIFSPLHNLFRPPA